MKWTTRLKGLIGVGVNQLRTERARTALAVFGVVVAVLSVTLLIGVGTGVAETGEQLLDSSEQDLWVSGGPIEFQPGTVGGVQNSVTDAHTVAAEIEAAEGVRAAVPLALQVVYVSTDGEQFETVVGTGVSRTGPLVNVDSGTRFSSNGQSHYANGTYSGPLSREVIISPKAAERYNVAVGDTLFIGGTITNARQNEFEVIGISPTFQQFVGSETVTLRLSELQTLTGSANSDRASLILVETAERTNPAAVRTNLERQFPEYTIRTNSEQFTAVLKRQAAVIAGGLSLVALSVVAGMFLSLNLFLSLVYQQRREFSAFRAIGGSRWSTVGIAAVQAIIIATIGGVFGLALSPVIGSGLTRLAATITGFEGLVRIPLFGYLLGAGIAILFGLIGTVIGVIRVSRERSVAQLK